MKLTKNKLIYLDNAATSFPKPGCVIKATDECIRKYCANPGRSAHKLALSASERVYCVREQIADFLSLSKAERVVFTSGATAALNLSIKSTVTDGAHILISDMEHNSVLRVVEALKHTHSVEYSVFNSDNLEEDIAKKLRPNTTHLVATLASNVTGARICPKRLSEIANGLGLKLVLDASQLLGHEKLNLSEIKFEALCCAGHKSLFGIPGVGFAVFGNDDFKKTFIEGGSGSESKSTEMPRMLPERLEAGTLPLPAIISLGAGIDFINRTGQEKITDKLKDLTERTKCVIWENKKIDLCKGDMGIVSFTAKDIPSELLAKRLDDFGVAVRGGFHCAPLMHKKLNTYNTGTVRVSLGYLNTEKQIDAFACALKCALSEL